MTVKELIALLKLQDPDATVGATGECDCGVLEYHVEGVHGPGMNRAADCGVVFILWGDNMPDGDAA